MTGRIPSRADCLKRAQDDSAQLKDQFEEHSKISDELRQVIDTEDPSIEDYQLPEAVERMSVETIEIAEQRKRFAAEVEAFDEQSKIVETETESIRADLQDHQLTNEELEQARKDQLDFIKSLFEIDSKLAVLVFEDKGLFEHAIRNLRDHATQYQTKLNKVLDEVYSLTESLRSAKEEYDERVRKLVEPLRQELHDTKEQLEISKALEVSMDEQLAQVEEALSNEQQERQTSETALHNEIDEHKDAIKRLRTDAEALLRQNSHLQTDIQNMESEKDVLSHQNDEQKAEIKMLEDTLKELEARLSRHNEQLQTQVHDTKAANEQLHALVHTLREDNATLNTQFNEVQAESDTLDGQVIQAEAKNRALQSENGTLGVQVTQAEATNRALQSEKDALYARANQLEAQIQNLNREIGDLTGQISHSEAQIHDLEAEKGDLIDRNQEYEQHIQALNTDHQGKVKSLEDELHTLQQEQATFIDNYHGEAQQSEEDKDALKNQIHNLERDISNLSIQQEQKDAQIENLEANVQSLEKQCDDQSNQNRQHLEEISQLKSELEIRENTLQGTIQHANEERSSSLQEIQQLQHFIFSKLLSIQNDQNISFPTAFGIRVHFKRQQLWVSQGTLARWIQGSLESLTNSTEDTLNSAETYQQILGSIFYLQSTSDIRNKEILLECMGNFRTWLTKACKDRTSILGLALDRAIKVIQEGSQSDPWFSTREFDASRIIDSRNSELPETTSVIADGFSGIILVVQGTDIQVCEATDIFMRQQTSCGMQLIFNEALNLPDLQLLADSWPHIDRWEPLGFWAVKVGRFNLVKKSGRIYEPTGLTW